MRTRSGVSLAEVLVATVLLAVGIGGALSALAAAARLRAQASRSEAVAEAADARVQWFASQGCLAPDTVLRSADGAIVEEVWRIARDSAGVQLDGAARLGSGARAARLAIAARRGCP